MTRELPFFRIGSSYGGNQDWLLDPMMHLGGCGALTACDCCIYFARHMCLPHLYPFEDPVHLDKRTYLLFSRLMKPYLKPRAHGIDSPALYLEGFSAYLSDRGNTQLTAAPFDGAAPYETARDTIRTQIERGFPIPTLTLMHADPEMEDYIWHWYILNGYAEYEDRFLVKAVTYGKYRWLPLDRLWNTGHAHRGGLILFGLAGAS